MTAFFGTANDPGNYADFFTVGPWLVVKFLFSAANLALAGFPLTKYLGENLPSRL